MVSDVDYFGHRPSKSDIVSLFNEKPMLSQKM